MANKNKFFITTAIPYVNDRPHVGHALEMVQTDVLARYHRLKGEDVFFLTGTDENALKNVRAAIEEGVSTRELVDRNAEIFRSLKGVLNLSWDDFIRTTEGRHVKGAQKLWLACKKDMYKKKYRGFYCVGCEEFKKEDELENNMCQDHKRVVELIDEENYFFALSRYQEKIRELIETDRVSIIPESRRNEMLAFIAQGLEDFSISRSIERSHGWGIPVPEDQNQIMYVWFDALSNYINAVGYGTENKRFQEWWQDNPNIFHVIGKGISRFHCIYWPAILLSAGLQLPKTIFIHGHITVGGQKMSKTIGNVVDPVKLVEQIGLASLPQVGSDAIRYFLLRELSPFEDGDFSKERFKERYNSDLASGLGNLVARVTTVALKSKFQNPNTKLSPNPKIKNAVNGTWRQYHVLLGEFRFNETLAKVWELITVCDRYIEEERPWERRKKSQEIVYDLLYALGNIAWMLQPFLPSTSEEVLRRIGITTVSKKEWKFKVVPGGSLFPRI